MIQPVRTFRFKNMLLWRPVRISEWIYLLRYWLGYFFLPNTYKETLNRFNRAGWAEITSIESEFQKKVREKKHLSLVRKEK